MKSTTDLEELIRHLSGRGDQGIDLSRDQSQLLQAIRARTRILFDEDGDPDSLEFARELDAGRGVGGGVQGPRRSEVAPLRWALALALFGVALGLGSGGIWWSAERSMANRVRAESTILLQEMRSILTAKPLDAVLEPGDPPRDQSRTAENWREISTELELVQGKLDALSRLPLMVARDPTGLPQFAEKPAGSPPASRAGVIANPDLLAMKADLATIRRELASGEAATTRQIQEMRTVLHEVNTVVRRVLSRPQPASNSNVTLPLLAVAVQALINNLQHQTAQVRGEAVEQLIRLGPLARSALPALQQMVTREPDPNVRSAVETAVNVISSN